ncbi:MAG: hypothetical protein HY928_13090 [Elusimicrobia bacterium]|nr:hypothetical protein [Elusimicrobiota bacterium]
MTRILLLASLAIPLATGAHAGASAQLDAAGLAGRNGAAAYSSEAAAESSGAVFEGNRAAPAAVQGSEAAARRTNLYAAPGLSQSGPIAPPAPNLPASGKKTILPKWAMYAAGGGLGFLQGALFGGMFAGLAGAAVGLAATHFYMKDDPGTALGISAGSIIGTFLGGPIGGLIGAAVGGLLGHLIGKLF